MSSFSKKQKSSSNSTSTTNLTDWSKGEYMRKEGAVNDVIDNFNRTPFEEYKGPEVADLTGDEQRARTMTRDLAPRADVKYRTFAEFDPHEYYNPFEDEVVKAAAKYFDDDYAGKIADNQARATTGGSYGGSRHGVMDAELARTSGDAKAGYLANIRKSGYDDAAGRFQRDSDNLYTQDVRNSDKDYADKLTQIDMLAKMGADERQIEQGKLLAEKAKYDKRYEDAWKRYQVELQTKLGLLSNTPMLTTTNQSGSSTTKYSDPLGEIGGAMKLGGSIADSIGGLFM